jgi:hypothetical protein
MTFTSLLDLSQDIDFHWLLSMSFLCWGLTLTFVYVVSVLRLDIDICLCRFCVQAWHRNGSCSCLSFRSSLFSHLMLLLTRKLQNQGFLVVKLKSFHHTWLINEFITAFDYSFGIVKPFFLNWRHYWIKNPFTSLPVFNSLCL